MIGRLLRAGIRHRWEPFLLLFLAVSAGAGAVAATTGLAWRIDRATAESLERSGPNLVLRPRLEGTGFFTPGDLDRVRGIEGVMTAVPWSRIEGEAGRTVLRSTSSVLDLYPHWELAGRWPGKPGERVRGRDTPTTSGSVGVLTTGEKALDRAIFEDLGDHPESTIERIEVRAVSEDLGAVRRTLERTLPGAEVVPLARVTETETALGHRLVVLLGTISGVILLLALGAVVSAALTELDSRRREIALLLSLGYRAPWIRRLLGLEMGAVALIATGFGFALGELLAGRLARDVLGVGGWEPSLVAAAATTAGTLALLAATVIVTGRRLEDLNPATELRNR